MDQRLKELVSTYINVPSENITGETVIDRSKVSSSIVLHRMYARLAENGYKVDNYWNIKTFEGLLKLNNGGAPAEGTRNHGSVIPEHDKEDFSAGIDIEEIGNMPLADDFRENAFYTMNFAPAEISYCIMQSNPYASFAGLFAVKEAIVKCDNSYKGRDFSAIVIDHSASGKPVFNEFKLSISHTEKFAAAIAMRVNSALFVNSTASDSNVAVVKEPAKSPNNAIAWLAFLLSIAAVIIALF